MEWREGGGSDDDGDATSEEEDDPFKEHPVEKEKAPDKAAKKPEEEKAPHEAAKKVEGAGALLDFAIADIGYVKVDVRRRQFNAHCKHLGPPRKVHRTPTCKECRKNVVSSKKPLGVLVQWLRQGDLFIEMITETLRC